MSEILTRELVAQIKTDLLADYPLGYCPIGDGTTALTHARLISEKFRFIASHEALRAERDEWERLCKHTSESRAALNQACLDYENEIAAVCQEDYSLKETFDALTRDIDKHIARADAAARKAFEEAIEMIERRDLSPKEVVNKLRRRAGEGGK